jgi:hypothetical protein
MVSVWGSTWWRSCEGSRRKADKLLIKPTGGPGRHSGGPGRQVWFMACRRSAGGFGVRPGCRWHGYRVTGWFPLIARALRAGLLTLRYTVGLV